MDGDHPAGRLLIDSNGALYGTTQAGGTSNNGIVFKLTPPAAGKTAWKETVLYNFQGGTDGATPLGGLLAGAGGVLYGTTKLGGADNLGTVFALTPPATPTAAWTESILHNFAGGDDGAFPEFVDLVADSNGALYGTTLDGGTADDGTVFRLTPPATGKTLWTESVLHHFAGGKDGANPQSGVVMDAQGSLYGTTQAGGGASDGVAYKLTPPASGKGGFPETILHPFAGGADGASPEGAPTLDSTGTLYGTTLQGGAACPTQNPAGCGVIYEITP